MVYTDAQRRRDYGYANGSPDPDLENVTDRLPWRPRTIAGRRQTVYAHTLVADLFVDAAHDAVTRSGWIPKRTDSYVERPIRGSSSWSLHSWAIAWDIFRTFADQPPPGGVWTPTDRMPASFVAAYTERGFTWGGTWNRKDTPHIEWSGPPPTRKDDDMTPQERRMLTEVWEAIRVGAPGYGVAPMAEAVHQTHYSIAGIGDNNLRSYINRHDRANRDETAHNIDAQTAHIDSLAAQPPAPLTEDDIDRIADAVVDKLSP